MVVTTDRHRVYSESKLLKRRLGFGSCVDKNNQQTGEEDSARTVSVARACRSQWHRHRRQRLLSEYQLALIVLLLRCV